MSHDQPILVRVARHGRAFLEIAATVLVILVCVGLLWAMIRGPQPTPPPTNRVSGVRPPPPPPRPKVPTEPISLDGAALEGAKTARVAAITYSDFQCPYCGRFAKETLPALRREYVETGKAIIAFRHVPLPIHPFAVKSAEAAECAGQQGKFWPMHDLLFVDPKQLDEASLRRRAKELSLDRKAFDACFAGQMADRVKQDYAEASAFGVTGTPTFFFGTVQPDGRVKVTQRLSGALPIERFRAVFDELIKSVSDSR